MSTQAARSAELDDFRSKVAAERIATIQQRPFGADLSDSTKQSEGPLNVYLPGKWSWGPAKPSLDW